MGSSASNQAVNVQRHMGTNTHMQNEPRLSLSSKAVSPVPKAVSIAIGWSHQQLAGLTSSRVVIPGASAGLGSLLVCVSLFINAYVSVIFSFSLSRFMSNYKMSSAQSCSFLCYFTFPIDIMILELNLVISDTQCLLTLLKS